MNYNKIKELQQQKKVSNRKIAKAIGMSDVGYGKMLENNSCDVETLEAIATFFKIPVSYFFDNEDLNQLQEKVENYKITRIDCIECIKKQKTIDELTLERDALRVELIELYREKKSPGKCG